MKIEVVYALPDNAVCKSFVTDEPLTVEQAIRRSGILSMLTELNLGDILVGNYSERVSLSDVITDDARIELYRPLQIDPMEARRRRAVNKEKTK